MWCRDKNRAIRNKSCSEFIFKPIVISDGKYKPNNENDELLVKWCNNYNNKLLKSKQFVEMYTGENVHPPVRCCGNYFECDSKEKLLKHWCEKRNAEIKKLLEERNYLNETV